MEAAVFRLGFDQQLEVSQVEKVRRITQLELAQTDTRVTTGSTFQTRIPLEGGHYSLLCWDNKHKLGLSLVNPGAGLLLAKAHDGECAESI